MATVIATTTGTREHWRIGQKDGKFLRVITADVARAVLRKDQAQGKFPRSATEYTTYVNNKPGMPLAVVRHGGRISFVNDSASTAGDMLMYAFEMLVKLSPYAPKKPSDSGWRKTHYGDSHQYLVNGRNPTPMNLINVVKLPDADLIDIRTTLVYSRRIEAGWSFQRPTGVLKILLILLRKRYGKSWQFQYRLNRYSDLTKFKIGRMEGKTSFGRKKKWVSYDQLYPTIVCLKRSNTARLIKGQREIIQ